MRYVGVLEAKNNLSKLIKLLESGEEDRVVITRNEHPVALITLFEEEQKRIGVAEGEVLYRDGWDDPDINAEVARLFEEGL